jgi:hypothetical protein
LVVGEPYMIHLRTQITSPPLLQATIVDIIEVRLFVLNLVVNIGVIHMGHLLRSI